MDENIDNIIKCYNKMADIKGACTAMVSYRHSPKMVPTIAERTKALILIEGLIHLTYDDEFPDDWRQKVLDYLNKP